MKKTLLLLTFILCSLTLSATTYEVYYDINTKQEANLLITVNNNTLKVGQKVYPLRLLGHINNGNVVYASYAYDTTQKTFCVSTTLITLKLDNNRTTTGYLIILDDKAYLAQKKITN